jgi:hypothetical protein
MAKRQPVCSAATTENISIPILSLGIDKRLVSPATPENSPSGMEIRASDQRYISGQVRNDPWNTIGLVWRFGVSVVIFVGLTLAADCNAAAGQ